MVLFILLIFVPSYFVFASCVIKTSVGRHSQPICGPILGQHVGRLSVDISVGMSVCTRPTPRPICCDGLSVVYHDQSTVGGIGVLFTVVLLK